MIKRRRRGSSSPPLVGVELNPGPRKTERRASGGRAYVKVEDRNKAKRRKKLSEAQRGMIYMGILNNLPIEHIARLVKCHPKTVRLWRARAKRNPNLKRLIGSGRPRKLAPATVRFVQMRSKRNRFLTATSLAEQMNEFWKREDPKMTVSRHTISRRLNDVGLKARSARKKPLLTPRNRMKRIIWAKKHKNWSIDQWKKVIWTDETCIHFVDNCGRTYVRRRPGEELKKECLRPTLKKGGGKLSIWSCFHWEGVGPMRVIDGNMDGAKYHTILTEAIIPFMEDVMTDDIPLDQLLTKKPTPNQKDSKGPGRGRKRKADEQKEPVKVPKGPWYFQQDNDPKHRSKKNVAYLTRKADEMGFNLFEWPSQSPDLNPIENVWVELKSRLRKRPRAKSSNELLESAKEEWRTIPIEMIHKLIESMPKRCREVLKNHGGPTSY